MADHDPPQEYHPLTEDGEEAWKESAGALFEAYLDALERNQAPPPDEFLAAHPKVSPELSKKLEALYSLAQQEHRKASASAEGQGKRLGEFQILRPLGRGGMGDIYLAKQESLDRQVALKQIRQEYLHSPTALARFGREARALARLRHPNIVAVHGFGQDAGVFYLAMEYVEGQDLAEILRQQADQGTYLPPLQAVGWAMQIAHALDAAHDNGLLHRDVKSGNIRITPEGKAVLVDFGLARSRATEASTLTRHFAGSPAFASPEQIKGHPLDPRTDIYSLGVTLYHALTGQVPFRHDSLEGMFHQILTVPPPPPRSSHAGIPKDLEAVVLKAMEKNPKHRYADAKAFAADLLAIREGRPVQARSAPLWKRLRHWTTRHSKVSVLATAFLVSLIGFGTLVGVQQQMQKLERKRQAENIVEQARQELDLFHRQYEENLALSNRVDALREGFLQEYLTAEEVDELNVLENQVAQKREERDRQFARILELLELAVRRDPAVRGTPEVRAELFLQRYREALDRGEPNMAEFFAQEADRQLPHREREEMLPSIAIELEFFSPGPTEVHLFRFQELSHLKAGAGPRMVPVPYRQSSDAFPPGSWALRIVQGNDSLPSGTQILELAGEPISMDCWVLETSHPTLRPLDRLAAVDGRTAIGWWIADELRLGRLGPGPHQFEFQRGEEQIAVEAPNLNQLSLRLGLSTDLAARGNVQAKVLLDGEIQNQSLPPGLQYIFTANPLAIGSQSSLGTHDSSVSMQLSPGEYLALLRRPGHVDTRYHFRAHDTENQPFQVYLPKLEQQPTGFEYVHYPWNGGNPAGFWMQRREVTCAEYLEFLNDPKTLAEIQISEELIRVPRSLETIRVGGAWPKDPQGGYQIPGHWRPDWPILGISWFDATAYTQWLTRKQDGAFEYRLPSEPELWVAAGGIGMRPYTYGFQFRPHWSSNCFSRPRPQPEPVMTYPTDESVYGIFDLCGSALEWQNSWFDADQRYRHAAGGGWAQGGPIANRHHAGLGFLPDNTTMETGFRMIAVPR
ncbi:MAG: hypothetical protein DWQ01_06940 [Planctomycetota bacterium]|nr:MAG: hypothetical protein DWQ01_06940 [Planctomycetota bacterium]